ncbi:hypothetical protein, partial [Escherichia coli]|uniref:hypothetical protein n=1 Tax=Escherichia coli TaxID=562 RepID=UPI00257918D6
MMSLWDALRMNMMISYQELVRTFPKEMKIQRYEYLNKNRKMRTHPPFILRRQKTTILMKLLIKNLAQCLQNKLK